MKLSEELKGKKKVIEHLKRQNDELNIYKGGYEKGIKQIRKDMLVLKFVNKTKTKIIRKYVEQLQGAHKFTDVADLRPQLQLYVHNQFHHTNPLHQDYIYMKNQLKSFSESEHLVNTADLVDFFLKHYAQKSRELAAESKKKDEQIKNLKTKQNLIAQTIDKHRANISNLPGLINTVIEEFLREQNPQLNRESSRLTQKNSKSSRARAIRDTFLTEGATEQEIEEERFFIFDFTTEFYGQLDEAKRREFIHRLMSNKLLLFGFREFLLRKLNPLIGGGREISSESRAVMNQNTSLNAGGPNDSRSVNSNRQRQWRTKINNENLDRSSRSQNKPELLKVTGNELDESRRVKSSKNTLDAKEKRGEASEQEVTMNVLGKRKILRYILKKSDPSNIEASHISFG